MIISQRNIFFLGVGVLGWCVYRGRPGRPGCVCSSPADTGSGLCHCCRCTWSVLYHTESSGLHTDFPLKHNENISYSFKYMRSGNMIEDKTCVCVRPQCVVLVDKWRPLMALNSISNYLHFKFTNNAVK